MGEFMEAMDRVWDEAVARSQRDAELVRYAAQLEDRAERANVHTAGLLVEIAAELRKIAGEP